MNMKSIAYWVATTLIALETFVGGITDLVHGGTELIAGSPVVGIVTHLWATPSTSSAFWESANSSELWSSSPRVCRD